MGRGPGCRRGKGGGKRYEAIRARIDEVLGPGDILCLPTSPRVAPLKNTPVDDIEIRYRHQAMHLLCIAGLGGLPQISLPMAELDGLPLGLSLNGPRGADVQLLRLARRLVPEASGEWPVGVLPHAAQIVGRSREIDASIDAAVLVDAVIVLRDSPIRLGLRERRIENRLGNLARIHGSTPKAWQIASSFSTTSGLISSGSIPAAISS